MSADCLKYDDYGKPVGLNWDAIRPEPNSVVHTVNFKPKAKKKKGKRKKAA